MIRYIVDKWNTFWIWALSFFQSSEPNIMGIYSGLEDIAEEDFWSDTDILADHDRRHAERVNSIEKIEGEPQGTGTRCIPDRKVHFIDVEEMSYKEASSALKECAEENDVCPENYNHIDATTKVAETIRKHGPKGTAKVTKKATKSKSTKSKPSTKVTKKATKKKSTMSKKKGTK